MKTLTKDRSTSTEELCPINTDSAASLSSSWQSRNVNCQMNDALDDFAKYEYDWDGQGAEAPSRTVIASARHYLDRLDKDSRMLPFEISAGPDGSICFEWVCKRFTQIVQIDDSGRALTVIDRINKTSHTSPF